MSPLKIKALLNLYCLSRPFDGYAPEQARSFSMTQAFVDFERQGLLVVGVTLESAIDGSSPFPRLTADGHDLVRRLCEVQP